MKTSFIYFLMKGWYKIFFKKHVYNETQSRVPLTRPPPPSMHRQIAYNSDSIQQSKRRALRRTINSSPPSPSHHFRFLVFERSVDTIEIEWDRVREWISNQ